MIRLLEKARLPRRPRRGVVLPLVAALTVVIVGLLAFSVDLGYISLVRGQMQSAADASALAAASQLFDRELLEGSTTQSTANADAQAQRFATANQGGGVSLTLGAGDVVYGHIEDPENPASPFDTTHQPYNSARVTVQRTNVRNGELSLFFAKIFNQNALPLQAVATATYEGNVGGFEFNDNYENQKCSLLPYTVHVDAWDEAFATGADNYTRNPTTGAVTSGPDGVREVKLFPTKTTPGNFGTVDIGPSNNSTSDISRQILYGPNKADFDAIGGKLEFDTNGELILDGDTGISAGVKDEMESIKGQPRIIPLYTSVTGNGNNSRYTIVRFVGCTVVAVKLTGGDKYIMIQPEFCVDTTAFGGGPVSDRSYAFQPLRLTR